MGVKTYQAYSMTEALAVAKRDLGADAVILDTRTFKRGGVLGVGRKTIFELTATNGDRAELSGRRGAGGRRPAGKAVRDAYRRGTAPKPSNPEHTRRFAQALAETHERAMHRPAPVTPTPVVTPSAATTTTPTIESEPTPVARRFILTPADQPRRAGDVSMRMSAPPAPAPESGTVIRQPAGMQEELCAIRSLVSQVLVRQTRTRSMPCDPEMPAGLLGMYLELVGQDLSEELADRIVNAARLEISDEDDEPAMRDAVLRHLAELVPAADPSLPRRSPDGRPLTIALIGPTGVGKTTTLAKLAATCKLKQGRNVGLVTCDTYRIAAVDQLRTYANIIGLPLEVALTPDQMRRSVETLSGCDVILIDTAGRGSNDRGRLDELGHCLSAAEPHEVHLVLSSTASEKVLLQEAEAFAEVGADRVVLTKLDEAVSFGVLVNVMQSIGKQLSFLTTGQEVPDHIEVGRPRRLAELVLGGRLSA